MSLLGRRRLSAIIFAVLIFFLFVSFRGLNDADLSTTHSYPAADRSTSKGAVDGSYWERYIPHYPATSLRPLPTGSPLSLPKVQTTFPAESESDRNVRLERQAAVKEAFSRCWNSYRNKAWLADELSPITGQQRGHFGGWGATLVDSLDTLWIMELRKEFDEAVTAAATISFKTTNLNEISVFETNIRYLGGFLAAYDLSGDSRLLQKAKEVGDMLYVPFDTPNRLPLTRWNLRGSARHQTMMADAHVLLAEIGSFSLEFIRLSLLTGDPKWFDAVQRITAFLHAQQNSTKLPGMWPVIVNPRDEKFGDHFDYTLGAMADSAYEYLPKTHALVGGLLPEYKEMYEVSMETAIRHNIFRPLIPDSKDILISGMASVRERKGAQEIHLRPEGQHLGCFTGGMLALGGKLVQNQTHVDTGAKLTDGCVWAYKVSPLGIMPETFYTVPCESKDHCPWDEKKWVDGVLQMSGVNGDDFTQEDVEAYIKKKHMPKGFTYVPDARYILRPEAIESVFILYRITGRKDLVESAWEMFQAIDSNTKTELANSALVDVMVAANPPKSDSMESFWFGETLKYFYLMFSEPDLISLDEYVFNTEAHPLKRLLPRE
ncbi:glycoside hydrolase [Naviculisporaceae sp. PSN 640]